MRLQLTLVIINFLLFFTNAGIGQGIVPVTQRTKDSINLTIFIRQVYKWHCIQVVLDKGFDPRKDHPSDIYYKGIDFQAVNSTINKYRRSGYFDEVFLTNYRSIAVRMDRELRHGTVKWREGALPPFNGTDDLWCDCEEISADYTSTLKLSTLIIKNDEANFNLIFQDQSSYKVRAKKKSSSWKITYLEGFDQQRYLW